MSVSRHSTNERPSPFIPHVLVVDDDACIQRLCQEVVGDLGYRSTAVPNGKEALNQILEDIYQLVILDLVMPVMDGTTTLDRLRQLMPDLPVIILTANAIVSG